TEAEWIEARRALLAKEKEFTRLRDRLAQERRALPWVKIEKRYVFDGPQGEVTLDGLFHGRSQLFLKHFMMGRVDRRNSPAAHSRSITWKGYWRIFRITTLPTRLWRARRSRKSRSCASGWAGNSRGSHRIARTSTMISTFPLHLSRLPPAVLFTISDQRRHGRTDWKTSPETACSSGIATVRSI